MKRAIHFFAILPLALVLTGSVVAQETLFTYQGRLDRDGLPVTGVYDFEAQVFDGPGPGANALTATMTHPGVEVNGGLFVLALDFGPGLFGAGPHHLEIRVREQGGGTFTTLVPRQHLTPAPKAVYAETAGGLLDATVAGTLTFDPPSGPPFAVSSSELVSGLNADLLDGLDSSEFVLSSGDTVNGILEVNGPGGNATFGKLGIFFGNDIAVSGSADSVLGIGLSGSASGQTGTAVFGSASGEGGTGVFGQTLSTAGPGAKAIHGMSQTGLAGFFEGGVHVKYASPPSKPQLRLEDPNDSGFARLRMQTGTLGHWDIAVGGTSSNNLRFYRDGVGDVMWITPSGQLHTKVLTILGGADIAEPFEMSGEEDLPKGTVVVIDEERPGMLKESSTSYDKKVAGIISGAGGVNTGLQLQQEGVLEDGQPVALTGRVYVKADASCGAIKPGDLLTTSNRPGHAMKASDHERARGATLGKAMTELEEGTGLVLVLVTLQ